MRKSDEEISIVSYAHREVHGDFGLWNETAGPSISIIAQDVSNLGVLVKQLLEFRSDLPLGLSTNTRIGVECGIFKPRQIEVELVEDMVLGQNPKIDDLIANSDTNVRGQVLRAEHAVRQVLQRKIRIVFDWNPRSHDLVQSVACYW